MALEHDSEPKVSAAKSGDFSDKIMLQTKELEQDG